MNESSVSTLWNKFIIKEFLHVAFYMVNQLKLLHAIEHDPINVWLCYTGK